jgi:hypothetical protein
MADLREMFAPKPKGIPDAAPGAESQSRTTGSNLASEAAKVSAEPDAGHGNDSAQLDKLPRTSAAAEVGTGQTQVPSNPFAGNAARVNPFAKSSVDSKPVNRIDSAQSISPDSSATPATGGANPLDDAGLDRAFAGLANLDQLVESIEATSVRERVHFDDELPATKPSRVVPPDADPGLRNFIQLIDGVYDVMHEPEILGGVMRSIMIELGDYPQYDDQVCDDDIHNWVRAMRRNMGLAAIKKTEKKVTRAAGGVKSKRIGKIDMAAAFDDLGLPNMDDM